jgi:hypothetical protein
VAGTDRAAADAHDGGHERFAAPVRGFFWSLVFVTTT